MPWVREGECNRCGSCCKGAEHMEATIGQKVVEKGYCPLFRWIAEGKGHCTDRNHPFYKRGCDVWPSDPHCIEPHPRCSYTFRWVD